ncbi:MAG TPA: hypothetical protein VMM36_09020 [Opitutaceae bacterium]|nr:hypothetical protein [Opitutaceae bacterium]
MITRLPIPTTLIAMLLSAHVAQGTPIDFAEQEIRSEAKSAGIAAPRVTFAVDPALGAQAYRFNRDADGAIEIFAGDAAGAMYGGLDVAEAIRIGTLESLVSESRVRSPHIANRGIKFNIPLDFRTPTYSDRTDASQSNVPEMWSMDFWHAYLDEMARDRYNILSLWSLHPFPSLVKVPEFPDVALHDVWQGKPDADGRYRQGEVVKKISIDEKIAFWREVMSYAQERGIAVYVFTWNVFTSGATGKYGITDAIDNPTGIAYTRASVRELVKTYPLLAGLGITAGEHMPDADDEAKENWLWATYGEGVRDALGENPQRPFRLIHRFHQTGFSAIMKHWKDFPGTFEFSFKYSIAHMYSITNPSLVKPALALLPAGTKMWLTVRNDDIYTFRFGDPDYMRDYVVNMPPAEQLGGFYMGSDGYSLGREFLDRDPEPGPRQLVIEKQWYSFMLLGRLSYDPTLSNAHFERVLAARFPGVPVHDIYRALKAASQTMPLTTRFFWGDIDVKWYPEGSVRSLNNKGYLNVLDFAEGESMPGANVLNIRQWRANLIARRPMNGTTPLQIADALEGAGRDALQSVSSLRTQTPTANAVEFRKTLVDCESLGWLALSYASKIRAACDLGLYDLSGDADQQASALRHLDVALDAWKHYAAVRDGQYVPALYGRAGYVNITELTKKVAEDIEIARNWELNSVRANVPGQNTEAGFAR